MKTIEVIIAPDGASEVITKGFAGSTCRQASEFLERALGKRHHETLTDEFYSASVTQDSTSQSTGHSS